MIWRKSSHSMNNGDCAEVVVVPDINSWRKSSYSAGGDCAEVGQDGAVVGVRDSKDPDGPWLALSTEAWNNFVLDLKKGVT